MKQLVFLVLLSVGAGPLFAQQFSEEFTCQYRKNLAFQNSTSNRLYPSTENDRSDSIDVLNYEIHLDITDFQNQAISGYTQVTFTARPGESVSQLPLDLLQLQVDSIIFLQQSLNFNYNDTLITIDLPQSVSNSDTLSVAVYYQGSPTADAIWGGFYFTNDYAYNMGVGFEAKPHNYGRIWHPCFDNFVERATYDFFIETADAKVATCNGNLEGETALPNGNIVRHWHMNQSIPTYLANVAVGNYETVFQSHLGLEELIPIELHAVAGDTTNLKNSFIHLSDAIHRFETAYGYHKFSKVGFSLVPFNAGAMEHATNISYPRYAANGNLSSETLMAHELAHHWWGDYATCETAEDMWLNEGWASFSELLFTEAVYGRNAYKESLENLHYDVLRNAHVQEGGFRAVSGVPHSLTYGSHVYNKGALVAHNLRGYLGDDSFFRSIQDFLDSRAFNSMNSAQFRDSLTAFSGVDMTPFFNDWVLSGGWSDFELDSFQVSQSGTSYDITLHLEQKLFGRSTYHTNTPVEVGFYRPDFTYVLDTVITSNQYSQVTVSVPFDPVWITLNPTKQLVYANSDFFGVIDNANLPVTGKQDMSIDILAAGDSSLLRVEHHWTKPDPLKAWDSKPYRLGDHYWEVHGIIDPDFKADATVFYDGRINTPQLDSSLVGATEDSLILLYRTDASDDWNEYDSYLKNVLGSSDNGFGVIEITNLRPGQYTFANIDQTVLGTNELEQVTSANLQVFPNPSSGTLNFKSESSLTGLLKIYSNQGQLVLEKQIENQSEFQVNLQGNAPGNYFYTLLSQNKFTGGGQFILR